MVHEKVKREPGQPTSALEGIRVLDLADESGAYCTKLLANLGADVVKVEPPRGDPSRTVGPFLHDAPDPEHSLRFLFLNTNKRGITLNLETADGRELLKRLAQRAGLLVETFPPGYLDRLGIGYQALSQVNPGLVLTSMTPFGQDGPYAHYPASDMTLTAMGGLMNMAGFPDRPPSYPREEQAYKVAGAHAASGALIALFHALRTGAGQHVDLSAQVAVQLATGYMVQYWELCRKIIKRTGGVSPDSYRGGRGMFRCKDGWFPGGALGGDRGWDAMLDWMRREGKAADLTDEVWKDLEYRRAHRDHIDEVWAGFVAEKSLQEVIDVAQRHRVTFLPVQSVEDIATDPHLQARDFFRKVEHPGLGWVTYPGPPFDLSETPWRLGRPAPRLGEHNQEVYGELGISQEELVRLRAVGAI